MVFLLKKSRRNIKVIVAFVHLFKKSSRNVKVIVALVLLLKKSSRFIKVIVALVLLLQKSRRKSNKKSSREKKVTPRDSLRDLKSPV